MRYEIAVYSRYFSRKGRGQHGFVVWLGNSQSNPCPVCEVNTGDSVVTRLPRGFAWLLPDFTGADLVK